MDNKPTTNKGTRERKESDRSVRVSYG